MWNNIGQAYFRSSGKVIMYPKTLKMYAMAGIVTEVKAATGKITVHNAHAPGLEMPIERDYTIHNPSALSKSKAGDFVHGTLLTNHKDVWLLEDVTFVTKSMRVHK